MIKKGTTKSGFKFKIDTDVMDNMEVLDAVAETDSGNPMAISKLLNLMLGDDKQQLYDHVRTEDGRVPISAIGDEIAEIFNALGEAEKK